MVKARPRTPSSRTITAPVPDGRSQHLVRVEGQSRGHAASLPGPSTSVATESGSERLDGRHQLAQAVLRIGEEHARLGVAVELVVDAGVAAAHGPLDDDDRLR